MCSANAEQVADLIKMDRLNRLNRVVNEVAEERAQRFAGRDLEVHSNHPSAICACSSEPFTCSRIRQQRLLLSQMLCSEWTFLLGAGARGGSESTGRGRHWHCLRPLTAQQAGVLRC
jgi:hypothetical protein